MLNWNCPGCGEGLEAPESMVGSMVICPACQRRSLPMQGSGERTFASPTALERTLDRWAMFIRRGVWSFLIFHGAWTVYLIVMIVRVVAFGSDIVAAARPAPAPSTTGIPNWQAPSLFDTIEGFWFFISMIVLWLLMPAMVLAIGTALSLHLRSKAEQIRLAKRQLGLPVWGKISGT